MFLLCCTTAAKFKILTAKFKILDSEVEGEDTESYDILEADESAGMHMVKLFCLVWQLCFNPGFSCNEMIVIF